MKHLVFTVSLFASLIYFSVSSLLGLSVTEDGGSTAFYKVYCAIVFVLFAFCYSKIYLKKRLTTRHIISYWILLFYIINALITGYATDTSMLVLVAFGLPAAGTAIYYDYICSFCCLVKNMKDSHSLRETDINFLVY